jgi:hypothetical protein
LAKLGIDAPYGKLLPMRSLAIKYFNHLRIFWYCLLDCWLVLARGTEEGLYVRATIFGLKFTIPSLIAVVGFFCWRINYGSFYIPFNFLEYESIKILLVGFVFVYWQNQKQFLGIEFMKCFSFNLFICME